MTPTVERPIVVVTGATKGIGLACARALIDNGFHVHMVSRSQHDLHELQEKWGGREVVSYSAVDLRERAALEGAIGRLKEPIYGLINNAGCWSENRVDDVDKGTWDWTISLNLEAPYFLTKTLQHLLEDGGRVVNIASQLASSGRPGFGPYCASKHGLIGLTRCWAEELAPRAITVNAVAPGWVATDSNFRDFRRWAEDASTDAASIAEQIGASTTLGRLILPREVASLVLFLISSSASGITGQLYDIK